MLKFLKDKFRKLHKDKAKNQVVTEIPEAMAMTLKAQNELAEKRAIGKMNKATQMSNNAKESLNQHIQLYLQNYTTNAQENERVFKIVDKSWKEYCYKVNRTQKLIVVDVMWFSREINRIVNSKEFKEKLTQKINGR